ncbi:MAG TPA: diacylglycerol kinase [Armatimonadota bacterium]|jgi:diacylglycerol kinase (ATP)
MESIKSAIEGIIHVFRTQRHMRFHFATASVIVIIGALMNLPREQWFLLYFAMALVFLTELLNTAIEACVDLFTDSYHTLAKIAKDIAAGAVVVATALAIIVAVLVFFNPDNYQQLLGISLVDRPADPFQVGVSGVILLFLLTIISKTLGNKGTFLSGGVVSGHAALGFYLSTSILFVSNQLPTAFLAMCIAALVAQSRVQARIHTTQEVVWGAFLGISVPSMMYRVLPWVASKVAILHGM